ncbi:right-handed parallel beta-helix repeat-containing protein [Sandaracinobacteroides saxicola]|uniref:Right handed beta helix domain-containing protein n=1 Tax=Sandaracinobacteroides saxicola TaxID=2759707 RepID=A0A7G5IJB9_9SPHN|nr:hypothetical protein [Sandaracinobacteroides saxicola]QMW23461.1 hypothetical protein H3309_02860 [Sandaracinobacteroides saxicola]
MMTTPLTATTVFQASSSAQIISLLRTITQPADIVLAPGNYGMLNLQNINPAAPVRIRSADANRRAVFTDMVIRDSSRLRFEAIEVRHILQPGEGNTTAGAVVRGGRDIHFVSCTFTGSVNNDPNDDGLMLRFMRTTGGLVMNSSFREARMALLIDDVSAFTFASNRVSVAREGLNLTGVRGVVIDANHFSDIRPNLALGDHSDAIQVYAGAIPMASRHITVSNNAMKLTSHQAQGFFVRNETGDPAFNHSDITVINNLYFGTMRSAFSLANVDRGLIARNTAVSSPDVVHEPGILARNSTGITIERNIAPHFLNIASTPTMRNNVDLADVRNPGGASPAAQFVGNIGISLTRVEDFNVRSGSQSAGLGAGFTPVRNIGSVPLAEVDARYRERLTELSRLSRL